MPSFSPSFSSRWDMLHSDLDGTLDPFRLAVLSDALEEAGCGNEWLLRHLRGEEVVPSPHMLKTGFWQPLRAPHVRGCWALDLILGKE